MKKENRVRFNSAQKFQDVGKKWAKAVFTFIQFSDV